MKGKLHHIIVVTSEFPPQPGGIGNHAYNLALHLHKEGFSVNVIADQRSKYGEEEAIFDQALPFLVNRIKRYNWRFRMYFIRIAITLRSFKKGGLVIATGKFALWNVAFCSMFFKTSTIAIIHGSEVNFKSAILRNSVNTALSRMDHIIAVSNYTKNFVKHLQEKITVIPNAIDLSQWKIEAHKKTHLKGDPILTTVGRVSSRKGQLNVIKHLSRLAAEFPNVHYHCIGIPEKADSFKSIAKDLEVEDHVTFHGSVSNSQLKLLLSETDIFLMLSSESTTGDVEGFGIAILEANAMGVPAIGNRGCGIEDAISNYESGILISNDDYNDFVDAIRTILGNKKGYRTSSVDWARQHSWHKIVYKYTHIIDNL